MLSSANVELLPDEQVVFEGGNGILTNQRLLVAAKNRRGSSPDTEIPLVDITEYKRVIGGQDSRIRQGLMLLAAGAVFTALELSASSMLRESGGIFEIVDVFLFMLGALGLVLGAYLVLRSLVRVVPHTTVFFRIDQRRGHRSDVPGAGEPARRRADPPLLAGKERPGRLARPLRRRLPSLILAGPGVIVRHGLAP